MRIEPGDLDAPDVAALIREHLDDMFATSPPESVHALSDEALRRPDIAFFTVRDDHGVLLGCGAIKRLGATASELRSMRTLAAAGRLYSRHGLVETGPFGDYGPDPRSTLMRLGLGAVCSRSRSTAAPFDISAA